MPVLKNKNSRKIARFGIGRHVELLSGAALYSMYCVIPSGSFAKSMSTVPAMAYAMTSGGEAR